jgi:hypothetical protein
MDDGETNQSDTMDDGDGMNQTDTMDDGETNQSDTMDG